jgi:hypothetical protein
VKLGKGEEEALAAGIQAILQEPQKKPLLLPHLSAEVLADQYLNLYRTLIPSEALLKNAGRVASTLAAPPESEQYSGISCTESQSRRDERGYI